MSKAVERLQRESLAELKAADALEQGRYVNEASRHKAIQHANERREIGEFKNALAELVEALGQGYQAENGFCDRFCLAHPENQNPHNNYKCDCGGDAIRKALAKVEQECE